MKKNNLNILRKKLDSVDNNLLKILKKRSILVNEVLKLKKFKNEIVDKKRINYILKKIKRYLGVPMEYKDFKKNKNIIKKNLLHQISI